MDVGSRWIAEYRRNCAECFPIGAWNREGMKSRRWRWCAILDMASLRRWFGHDAQIDLRVSRVYQGSWSPIPNPLIPPPPPPPCPLRDTGFPFHGPGR